MLSLTPPQSSHPKPKVHFANKDSSCRSRHLPPFIQFSVLCYVCHLLVTAGPLLVISDGMIRATTGFGSLCRQLCLSPLARTPHKNGRPEAVDQNGHGNGHVSAYELMRLTAILLKNNAIWLKTFSVPRIANRTITGTSHRA